MVVKNLELCPSKIKHRELLKRADEIVKLYLQQNLSTRQIAKKLGTNKGSISLILKKYNVALHTGRSRIYSAKCQDCNIIFSSKCPTVKRCDTCHKIEGRREARDRKRSQGTKFPIRDVIQCIRCASVINTTKINREYCDDCRKIRRKEIKKLYEYTLRERGCVGFNSSIKRKIITEIFNECNGKCVYCNSTNDITIDHIVPLTKNGTNSLHNLVLACRSCNSKKRNKYLLNFLWAQLVK